MFPHNFPDMNMDEASIQKMMDAVPHLAVKLNPAGDILWGNKMARESFPDHMAGHRIKDIFPELDEAVLSRQYLSNPKTLRTTTTADTPGEGHRLLHWELMAFPLKKEADSPANIMVVANNATGYQIAVKELKVASERTKFLEAVINPSPAVIAVWRQNKDEIELLYVSDNIGEHFGYTPEIFRQKNDWFSEILFPDDAGKVFNAVSVLTSKHQMTAMEFRIYTRKGQLRWMDCRLWPVVQNGQLERCEGIFWDITERKKAETKLKESENQLKLQKLSLEQKNIALRELLEQIEIEKKRIKDDIMQNLNEFVMPLLDKLKLTAAANKHLILLEQTLKEITSPFGSRISTDVLSLSPREIEICNMIKNNLSSKEIADILNISLTTVDRHRNNIRKKLGLTNNNINLTSYLRAI